MAGALDVHGLELARREVRLHIVIKGEVAELLEKRVDFTTTLALLLQLEDEPACLVQVAQLTHVPIENIELILGEVVELNLPRDLVLMQEKREIGQLHKRRELNDEVLRVHTEALRLPARVRGSIASLWNLIFIITFNWHSIFYIKKENNISP